MHQVGCASSRQKIKEGIDTLAVCGRFIITLKKSLTCTSCNSWTANLSSFEKKLLAKNYQLYHPINICWFKTIYARSKESKHDRISFKIWRNNLHRLPCIITQATVLLHTCSLLSYPNPNPKRGPIKSPR